MIKETNELLDLSKIAYIYNSGQMNIVGFSEFIIKSGTSRSYPTSRCAIIIPTCGTGTFTFDNESFPLSPGMMLHGCPDKLLTIHASSQENFEYINLYYNADCHALFSSKLHDSDKVISILDKILKLNDISSIKHQFLIDKYTSQFFELLFSNVLPDNILSEADLIKDTLEYIHDHYQSALTLQQIADYSGETTSRIGYLFQKNLGVRPINYLIDYRIKKSLELLHDTAFSIDDIGKKVGYDDALYFSRIFKKRMGFSPINARHIR